MKRELTVHMTASPEAVYALVTDVRRMGEWSPECLGGAWLDGAVGPAVGTRFTGKNKRKAKWATTSTVVAAMPGREFAFEVGKGETIWRYQFEPAGDGCDVTESFEILKSPNAVARLLTKLGTGVRWRDREGDLVEGMRTTLSRLRGAAEGGADGVAELKT